MELTKVLSLFILSLSILISHGQYTCKMYGQCYFDGQFNLNCPSDIAAPNLFPNGEVNEVVVDVLERRCPHLLIDDSGNRIPENNLVTCCSQEQIIDMDTSLQLADSVLSRCPTCLKNFARYICDFACSVEQSKYLDVYSTISPTGVEYVNETDVRIYRQFMEDVYKSCEDVVIPQMGVTAVSIMCGGVSECTAYDWFSAQGDVMSPYVPFQINFTPSDDEDTSLNAPLLKCNEAYNGSISCSCSDCFDSCPTGAGVYFIPSICTVLSINCVSFSIGLTVFVIGMIIISILTIVDFIRSRSFVDINETNGTRSFGKMNILMSKFFSMLSTFSAENPLFVMMLSSWLCMAAIYGVTYMKVTAKPIEIWSSPYSITRKQLEYYNSRFDPFYRTTQLFFQIKGLNKVLYNNQTFGPAFNYEVIREVIQLENEIFALETDEGIRVEDVCVAPLSTDDITDPSLCTVMSISAYLGNDLDGLSEDTYLDRIRLCMNNFYEVSCLATWGGGTDPKLAFGGFEGTTPINADTLIISIPLKNNDEEEFLTKVLSWEAKFLELIKDYETNRKPDYIDLSYAAERSLEDELARASRAEILPILISYIMMFIYVTISLGKLRSLKNFLADSKIVVGVCSIIIVLLAIGCGCGMLGYFDVPVTLLAINVLPFFILSVGVDNIFIMVNVLDKEKQNLIKSGASMTSYGKNRNLIFGRMMAKVGPSILVTILSQLSCFAIGTLSKSPAVYTFALVSTASLFFLFLFQITVSISILSLDYQRSESKRFDLLCCIQKKVVDDTEPFTQTSDHKGFIERLMVPYADCLLKIQVKVIVMVLFLAWLGLSIMFIPHVELGLDQELSFPYDSYARKYLISVAQLLEMGAPVYFVLKSGLNFSEHKHQNLICGGQMCNSDSLYTQIYLASLNSEITYISTGSNSWLDDYFDWTALKGSCCKYDVNDDSFCLSTNTSTECSFCDIEMEEYGVRPTAEEFRKYLPWFLKDLPSDSCAKAGLASYRENVNYILDNKGRAIVEDSNFMAYHTALYTSKDYYEAYRYAKEISDNITAMLKRNTDLEDIEVFPYSVFYVYFEMYLTMWEDSVATLGYSLLAILGIHLFISGFNILTSFVTMVTIIMILVNMLGLMYIWNIPLNPVSLVNLIISLGIGVEFCSHIVHSYSTSTAPLRDQPKDALIRMGSNVINGVTLTNIPIVVLAFAATEMYRTMFFKMFFGLVIIGFLHGIVFLPVFLSYVSNSLSYRSR